ncbi:MAG: efflux RND transporter permease subunit, partial [Reyranellaceae bacterium]
GGAYVLLEFEAGFDSDKALADVRDKVKDARPEMPPEADEPKTHEVNLSLFPILVVTLAGNIPETTLLRVARNLQDEIETIPAVLSATIAGDREEQVEILIDPLLLESYGISANEAVNAVNRSNRLIAAGAKDTGAGRFALKVPGLYETVQDILDQPLKVSGDSVVKVRDVASVTRTFMDPESFARVNGKPAVALEVSKRTGENIIDTIERVQQVVAAESANWPAGIEASYSRDKSKNIRTLVSDLESNVVVAVTLVMVVCIFILGWRTGLLVGLAIPASFLTGILALAAFGLTLNIVVLFSLILASGMLVDAAIVVTEYADRKMAEGMARRMAYAEASRRMAWPVISSALTTLAVFMPLLFWPGVVGEFMKYLPITLLVTLTASLLVALIFVPVLGALIGKPGAIDPKTLKALAAAETGDLNDLRGGTRRYIRVLEVALRHPGKVLAGAFAALFLVVFAYGSAGNGVEFFPSIEPDNAVVQISARGNLAMEERDAIVRQVESRILDMKEIRTVYARTGKLEGGQQEQAEDVIGTIQLEFVDWDSRRKADVILEDIRKRTADIAGIVVSPEKEKSGPPVGKPVQVRFETRYPELLDPAVEKLRAEMARLGGFVNVEDNRALPGIDWRIEVDRAQAAKFGADVSAVGDIVKLVTAGIKLGEYRPDDVNEEIEIRVRYPERYRTISQLDSIKIQTEAGLVPIGNFVERKAAPKVGKLDRVDGNRVMTVKAEVAPGLLVDAKVKEVQAWIANAELDPRLKVRFKGESEEQQKTGIFLVKALFIAIGLMTIILLWQFNSFYSLGLVLSAIVLSTIGVFVGLLVTGQPFGVVMSGIGVVALAGIIVNNNIILIDTFDDLRRQGMPVQEAIVRTAAQRLRPVLLTTGTTILGLLPMVVSMNIDFVGRSVAFGAPSTQWWTQLSLAIAAGLTFGTVLTLIVTPCALMLRGNWRDWRNRRKSRSGGGILKAFARGNRRDGMDAPPIANAAE